MLLFDELCCPRRIRVRLMSTSPPALRLVKTGRPTLAQYRSALSTVALGRTVPELTDRESNSSALRSVEVAPAHSADSALHDLTLSGHHAPAHHSAANHPTTHHSTTLEEYGLKLLAETQSYRPQLRARPLIAAQILAARPKGRGENSLRRASGNLRDTIWLERLIWCSCAGLSRIGPN
jgi:hypothetical protein